MAIKTVETNASVNDFIDNIDNASRQRDSRRMKKIMYRLTRKRARMWGDSLVGFGRYQYRYASGHEGEFFVTGFSPRKQAFTIYIMPGYSNYNQLLKKLGRHKKGKSCLHLRSLDDVDMDILEEIIRQSVQEMKSLYPTNLPADS